MENKNISPNSLMLVAMTNEFCQDIERALEMERDEFVSKMLRILPRIYVAVTDVAEPDNNGAYYDIDSYLSEESYNSARDGIYRLLGEDDVYLEVFEEDMKYSDTPIATTISENLCDLYQEFYNFVVTVQNAPSEDVEDVITAEKENFTNYWGQALVNVMRALHSLKYTTFINEI